MAVAHHPVRSVLQTDGVELVDVGWTPRPTDVGSHVPVVAQLIVSCKACREVAIEFEIVVVGVAAQTAVAVDRHHAEIVPHAQGTLQPTPLCLVQKIASHGEGGEVGYEGGLFGSGVVVVGLIGVRQPHIG